VLKVGDRSSGLDNWGGESQTDDISKWPEEECHDEGVRVYGYASNRDQKVPINETMAKRKEWEDAITSDPDYPNWCDSKCRRDHEWRLRREFEEIHFIYAHPKVKADTLIIAAFKFCLEQERQRSQESLDKWSEEHGYK
jgi:hypothetical protein